MILISFLWRAYLIFIILAGHFLPSYLMVVIPSSLNDKQRIPLQGKYFYQIEIYEKIYLINHERSHLYLYKPGGEPLLIVEGSSRSIEQSPLTTNYDPTNAPFSEITDVTGDVEGNLYISECSTNRIFKLVPSIPETTTTSSFHNITQQYTIELLSTSGGDLAHPYGLHYLEYAENKKRKLEEGLYFINQQTCQIRFISKNTRIIETFYTMNGPCSYDMTFLSIHALSQTIYYFTQHPSTIHKLQLLTLPQQREGRKDLFLHERVLESDFQERIVDISGNEEEKGEERNRLLFIQRYLLSKVYYNIYDVPTAPPSIAPTPIMIASNNTSDLIYSSSHKARRRLQTVSLLIDFAFAPSDVSGTPAITVANRGSLAPTVVGTLQGTPVATCLNLAWKPGYTSALSLVSTSSQYMSLNTLAFPATGMSFAFWYRCNGCASNTRVFDFGNAASTYQMIYRIDTDATVTQSSSTSTISTPSSVCNQGAWCFIVWTMTYVSSQSSQTSSHIIYLNGSQYSTASGFYPATVNRGQNYIGAANGGVGPYCTMLVGRFQLYDAVLTPTQVNNLYLNGALNSAAPTSQPSSDPTSHPSGQPSRQPSRQPTGQPSNQPSSQPSGMLDGIGHNYQLYVTNYAGSGIVGAPEENMTATTAEIDTRCIWIDSIGTIYTAGYPKIWTMNIHHPYINTFAGDASNYEMPSPDNPVIPLSIFAVFEPLAIWGDSIGNLYCIQYGSVFKIFNDSVVLVAGGGTNAPDTTDQYGSSLGLTDPSRLWVDSIGSLYVTDQALHYVYRINVTSFTLRVYAGTGIASFGTSGTPATTCELSRPYAITGDTNGNIYFSELDNYIIRSVAYTNGIITLYAGNSNNILTGALLPATSTGLSEVVSLWMDSHGNLYYLEKQLSVIRVIVKSSGIVFNVAGSPEVGGFRGDGGNSTNALIGQGGENLCGDSIGNLYLGDRYNYRIRKITKDWIISTIAGTGFLAMFGDYGAASSAQMSGVKGIWVNSNFNAFISDSNNCRIRKVYFSDGTIRTIGGTGSTGIQCGYNGEDLPFTSSMLDSPTSIWGNTIGDIYFTDISRVKKASTNSKAFNVTTIAGGGNNPADDTSNPKSISLSPTLTGIWGDSNDNLYFCDSNGNKVWKLVLPSSSLVRVAGTGIIGDLGDSGPARNAQLSNPSSVWKDTPGLIYIADTTNNKIRQVLSDQKIVTFAGGGTDNCENCPLTQTTFDNPYSIVGDRRGNIFVADRDSHRIRQISWSSVDSQYYIFTIVGNGQSGLTLGLTPATDAQISSPVSLAVDRKDNLYIASSDYSVVYKASYLNAPTSSPTRQPTNFIGGSSSSLKNGLVAYYPFDGNVLDKSGNSNNGVMAGGVTFSADRFGINQGAVEMDGTSGYIIIGKGSSFNFVENMSVAFWVSPKYPMGSAYCTILDKSIGNTTTNIAGWSVQYNPNYGGYISSYDQTSISLAFDYITGINNVKKTAKKTIAPYTTWTHLTYVKQKNQLLTYINGIQQDSVTVTSPIILTNGDLPLIIGGHNYQQIRTPTAVDHYYSGKLDELFINCPFPYHQLSLPLIQVSVRPHNRLISHRLSQQ